VSYPLVPLSKFLTSVLQVITEELGLNLENVDLDMLGSCKKVSSNC
jgi:chaperonin GroEL (HSP60 family)